MTKRSAGILLYRRAGSSFEVLLVHPGGPFWENKDTGSWSIPKGEYGEEEDALAVARREFEEETGFSAEGSFTELPPVTLKSGKVIRAFALEGSIDASSVSSNLFEMEWPPRSGFTSRFPEVDRAEWFGPETAKKKLNPAQAPLIDALAAALKS
jgi:predicted NUDIX family NTP pyrophosphohydrolase